MQLGDAKRLVAAAQLLAWQAAVEGEPIKIET